MTIATLRNDFHGSTATVCVPDDGRLTFAQTRQAFQTLCPSDDCKCGRLSGPQDVRVAQVVDGEGDIALLITTVVS